MRRGLVVLLDRRLALTEVASFVLSEAFCLLEATRCELTAGIGAGEYAMAVSVLERMTVNADRLANAE